ncbi:MAG: phage tail protein [Gaiellaceae bacterium]
MRTIADVRAVPHLRGGRIDLKWSLPPNTDYDPGRRLGGVVVVRRERTFPRDPSDGVVVYDGAPVAAVSDATATSQHTYYYTVYAVEEDEPGSPPQPPIWRADAGAQAWALSTTDFGSTAKLYALLPGVHQARDAGLDDAALERLALDDPSLATALAALPPDIHGTGQLRRFLRAAAAPLDLIRSSAEALRDLHDVDVAPPQFLPLLASWLGWEIDGTLPVHEQRNEVKFAPRLYRTVGTVDSLRRLVTRYTGWYTRAAEMEQALVRSNQPPQLNLFAAAADAGEWLGTDDASSTLGFGPGNRTSSGSDGPPATAAVLTGSTAEPFALRPTMELTVIADGRLPVTVRFQPGDFGDIAAATAAEVAAALSANCTQLTGRAVAGGFVELASDLLGAESSLEVSATDASLVALEGAPRGRPAAFLDGRGRVRLVFAAADPLDPVRTEAARAALSGTLPVVGLVPGESGEPDPAQGRTPVIGGAHATDRILVKTWVGGGWREARPLTAQPPAAQGDPAAAALGGDVVCAWVEDPGTDTSRLRFATGAPGSPQPAALASTRSEPFVLEPGLRLVFAGRWPVPEGAEVAAGELVPPLDPAHLTAADVVGLLAPHLVHVSVAVGPRNTLVFSTTGAGGDERLQLDLDASTAAAALGFGPDNAAAAGDWGDVLDWTPAADVAGVAPGRLADTSAAAEEAAGRVHLFWAAHNDSRWRIRTAVWDGVGWTPPVEIGAGAAGNREPCALFAPPAAPQLLWSQLGSDGRWTLRRSVLAGGVWGADARLLQAADEPANGTEGDREPALLALGGSAMRVFFRSDRSGAPQVWSSDVDLTTGIAATPIRVTSGAAHHTSPAPLPGPDKRTWLVHRSDENVELSRVGVGVVPNPLNRVTTPEPAAALDVGDRSSTGVEDLGARRRFAGSPTPFLGDVARFARRREWDDLLALTPQRTVLDPALMADDDLYTRGTVGLYLSPTIEDDPLTERTIQRLQGALQRFLPAPVRTVVVLTPHVDEEFVYGLGRDIEERFYDDYPFADSYAGATDIGGTVALPDWALFITAAPPAPVAHRTASLADLTTLRSRTWFPPPV